MIYKHLVKLIEERMKKILAVVYIIITFGCVSCYEDKGDYDYKAINEISISGIQESYERMKWQDLRITPELKFSLHENDSLAYRWEIDGRAVSTERNLDYSVDVNIADDAYKCRYVVTNTNGNVRYFQEFELKVVTAYNRGLLVLSEQDGESMLSFRPEGEDSEFLHWGDLFAGKPLSLEQPYSMDADVTVTTSKAIYRLDKQRMEEKKKYDGETMLVPESALEIKFCKFTDHVDDEDFGCMISKKGQVYVYKSRNDFFSSPSPVPVLETTSEELIDYELSDICLIYTLFYGQTGYFLGYDNKVGRFLHFANKSSASTDRDQMNSVTAREPIIGLPLFALGQWDYGKCISIFYDPKSNVAKVVASHAKDFAKVTEEQVVTLDNHKFTPESKVVVCDATARVLFNSGMVIYQSNVRSMTSVPTVLSNKLPTTSKITMLKLSNNRKSLYVGVDSGREGEFKGDVYVLDAVTGEVVTTYSEVGGAPVDILEKY